MNRAPIIAVVIMLVFVVADFYSRLTPQPQTSGTREVDLSRSPVDVRILDDERGKILRSRLDKYDVTKKPEPKKPKQKTQISQPKVYIMPEEQQNQQQGRLDELFDDKYKYILRATFNNDGHRFAVLERHDLESRKMEEIIIRLGDSLAGYRPQEIGNTYIKLKKQERTVELRLFIHKINA